MSLVFRRNWFLLSLGFVLFISIGVPSWAGLKSKPESTTTLPSPSEGSAGPHLSLPTSTAFASDSNHSVTPARARDSWSFTSMSSQTSSPVSPKGSSKGTHQRCVKALSSASEPKSTQSLVLQLSTEGKIKPATEALVSFVKNQKEDANIEFTVDPRSLSRWDLGETENRLISQLSLELALLGYRLQPKAKKTTEKVTSYLKNFFRWKQTTSYRLQKDLPPYVSAQAKIMLDALKGKDCCNNHNPATREYYSFREGERAKYIRLTPAKLSTLKPGVYSFVFITNEPFLRVGLGHHYIGEGRGVYSAGDISIVRDLGTNENRIDYINARSDTYRPMSIELISAMTALWRQNIYPEDIQILNWDNTPSELEFRTR